MLGVHNRPVDAFELLPISDIRTKYPRVRVEDRVGALAKITNVMSENYYLNR